MPPNVAASFNPKDTNKNLLFVGSNLVEDELATTELSIETIKPPAGMTPLDTAHFYDESQHSIAMMTIKLTALKLIKARMLTSCSNFLSRIERQSNIDSNVFGVLQNAQDTIHAFLREHSTDGLSQFTMALEGVKEGNTERLSAAMTHLRRCLRTIADLVCPAQGGAKGLSDDKYLNRLSKFIEDCAEQFSFKSPIDIQSLEALLRDVNDRASKGVHANVSYFEAQQIIIAAILYISNVCAAWELWRNQNQ